MRHILTSVVLIVLLFPTLALGETMDDLMIKDGLYYKKDAKVPFTGTMKEFRAVDPDDQPGVNGQLWKNINYKNGQQDSFWEHYYEGQLEKKGNYKNGQLIE